jgi:hypothetical protein
VADGKGQAEPQELQDLQLLDGILARGTKINNGIPDGTNSLIQAAKDSARGFRSTKNFITTIYLSTGKLKFNSPT